MSGLQGVLLELWGGVECTVNRVGDTFRDQLVLSGHDAREDDLDRFAALGLRTLRFPVLWERTAPGDPADADWRWADARLARARALGIRPIVTLVHHGSGPPDTHLLDPRFPERLAAYARAVALRYPWIDAYTPVNEPLTTARFSALYGLWYPHARSDLEFARAVLNECRATVLAMRAIREIAPDAALVQTEDLGRTDATPLLAYQAEFDNERRWLAFDLLAGRLGPDDRLWRHLRHCGIEARELEWFRANQCPPDMVGVNHYLTSNRYLDPDLERYPPDTWGGNGRHRYADVASVRVLDQPYGPAELLEDAWRRYRLPLAITEVHLGCTREEQCRWLRAVWNAAHRARERGLDVRAVTAWALLGAFDWDSLLTRATGRYEPGAFDIRGPAPRLTALGRLVGELAESGTTSSPVARADGWWERPVRFMYGHGRRARVVRATPRGERPILVTGGGGLLATAFDRITELRGLRAVPLSRAELDIADPAAVERALDEYRPWAVVNAATTREFARCTRDNVEGPAALARACRRNGTALVTFSCDLVFSAGRGRPRLESDPVSPRGAYAESKAAAERGVIELMPEALIARTGALFGADERASPLARVLEALGSGEEAVVAAAVRSFTFVPDLVNAVLDLLLDGEHGIWHLATTGALSWLELARRAAALAGLDASRLREAADPMQSGASQGGAPLDSKRGRLLPSLEDALTRYVRDTGQLACARVAGVAARPAAGA